MAGRMGTEMSKTDEYLQNEAIRLRKEADREERAAIRRGDDPAHCSIIRLNRLYAANIEAGLI
jgi:hypothetical protein